MSEKSSEYQRKTDSRYSLLNRVIEEDLTIGSAPNVRRHLRYAADTTLLPYLERFTAEGLVLGRRRAMPEPSSVVFSIPANARPLRLEAPGFGIGDLVYTDEKLLYDLGSLCGAVAWLSEGRTITGPAAEDAFALVEFVGVGDKQLFVIPGVERMLGGRIAGSTLAAQMEAFSGQFSGKFGQYTDKFIEGYTAGLQGGSYGS